MINRYEQFNKISIDFIIVTLILTALGCNNQAQQAEAKVDTGTAQKVAATPKRTDSGYYTTKDTLLIVSETGDSLGFNKAEFNLIVDHQPELYAEYPRDPDFTYYCSAPKAEFNSELGQD
jgi:hypothetical protein